METRYNHIGVLPVRSLQPGDLIAHEFLGQVVGGQVEALVLCPWQLTQEQREYLVSKKIEIPDEEYKPIGGPTQYLIFGQFMRSASGEVYKHMFMDFDTNVAVFPSAHIERKKQQEDRDADCATV